MSEETWQLHGRTVSALFCWQGFLQEAGLLSWQSECPRYMSMAPRVREEARKSHQLGGMNEAGHMDETQSFFLELKVPWRI